MCFTTKTRYVSEMKQVVKSLKVKSASRKQSVITVFQYFKYNKLKNRNIVVRGKVTISTVEQNDTCTSI